MNNKIKRAVGIGLRAALVLAILFVIIFKYNDLVNIDVRALVEKTNTLFEAGTAVVGVYSLKATFAVRYQYWRKYFRSTVRKQSKRLLE